MGSDARALTEFYQTPMGQMARRVIQARLQDFWPDLRGRRLLGYGFAIPYLPLFAGQAERAIAAMPAAQGVVGWPREKPLSLLCAEDCLPFPDLFFDRILVVHGLEAAEGLRPLLRQLWRVLAPEGRLLVVAPNRASLWAQVQRSPFGYGRPFSRGELDQLLRDALFEPGRGTRALYAPPLESRALVGRGHGWERFGARLMPALGGVHVVEAGKSIYAAAPPLAVETRPLLKAKTANDF
jgi:SAM-dependent methyltransferase